METISAGHSAGAQGAVMDEPLAAQLSKLLGKVGRALRYRTRATQDALGVTGSEAELLRLLGRRPGLPVQAAAAELGIASNSVSTLVKQLGREGLVDRGSDPLDGRVAVLKLTPQAEAWVKEVGSAREEALTRALAQLSPDDTSKLERALPALAHLAQALRRA
ncbi:MAG: MarR family transcriptional regulator [Chloroflexi bacterium]|nr:MarR family transcriptional regulator [Chloroflexota bacterium]